MLSNPAFWVGVAFALFLLLAFRPVGRMLAQALDTRANRVSEELREAEQLREEAQALLAHYQRKQQQILKEAQDILANAKEEAARVRSQSLESAEASVDQRLRLALDKISQTETAVIDELRNEAIMVAVYATENLLRERLDDTRAATLIDNGIEVISKKFH